MIINHNIAALNTHRQLNNNNAGASKSLEKLSSGLRINRAGDDAAGLAISEKMRSQIRGLDMASKNAQDSISLIQTAEGAMNEVHSILQRMRELAVQSANDTNTNTDREELQKEVNQLTSEINRIGNTTEFNTKKLLDGSLSATAATNDKTVVVDNIASKDFNYAVGVTVTGSQTLIGANGAGTIDIANGDGGVFDWTAATAGTITIQKDGDELKVSLVGGDDGTNKLDFSDKNAVLKDGFYEYNDHGISFKISESDFKAMSATDKVEIDLAARNTATVANNGSIGLVSDYKTGATLGNNVNVIKGFSVDGSKLNSDAATVDLKFNNGELTVTIKDASGAALNTVTTKDLADGDTFEAYGIKFTFDQLTGTDDFELNTINLKSTETAVTKDNSLQFQIGANEKQSMSLAVEDIRAKALGIVGNAGDNGFSAAKNVTNGTDNVAAEAALDISTSAGASAAITKLDSAIKQVSSERSKLGAAQNRLEHTINNLGTASENLTSAESRIRDVDMAKEMMEFTKNNILTQAAQSMLAQANQQPQGVLQLLR